MFCKYCGAKIGEGARFCTTCGQSLVASGEDSRSGEPGASDRDADILKVEGAGRLDAASEPQSSTDEEDADAAPDADSSAGIGEPAQNEAAARDAKSSDAATAAPPKAFAGKMHETRARARRKIPLVLIVVLVALAVAGAAFAAAYVYTHYVASAQQSEQAEAASTEGEEEENEDDLEESEALYNNVLAAYRKAEEEGWPATSDEGEVWSDDLNWLGEYERGEDNTQTTSGFGSPDQYDVCYAYTDLGNDGIQDLAIALVAKGSTDASSYSLVGLFTSDGRSVYSPTDVSEVSIGGFRSWWYLLSDGLIANACEAGAEVDSYTTYKVVDGQLAKSDEFSVDRLRDTKYIHNGESITEEEFTSLDESASREGIGLDWHKLSEFTSIESDKTDWMPKATADRFDAYAKKCKEYIEKYGEPASETGTYDDGATQYATHYRSGLSLATLIDFDDDGSSELLVVYRDDDKYRMTVLTYSNGEITKAYDGDVDEEWWAVSTFSIKIYTYNGKPTLFKSSYGDETFNYVGYQLESSKFKKVVEAQTPATNGYADAGNTINGESATQDEAIALTQTASSEYLLMYADDGAESSVTASTSNGLETTESTTQETLSRLGVTD